MQMMMTFGMKISTFPDDLSQLRELLLELLGKATKQELICLVLDAVDDLDTPAGRLSCCRLASSWMYAVLCANISFGSLLACTVSMTRAIYW
jgi:hypothetical protein